MNAILRFAEAALLVSMGTFMAVLARSSMYWQFLNPKFAWLTFVTGVVLTIIGFGALLNRERCAKLSELAAIVIFLGLALVGTNSSDFFAMESEGVVSGSFSQTYADAEAPSVVDGDPSIVKDGTEYTKLNVAELLTAEKEGRAAAGDNFAIQGTVVRTPEMDQAGFIGVGRLMIACCFADSTGVLSLVRVDDPTAFESRQWVRVLGVLEEDSPALPEIITLSGALTAIRSNQYIMRAVEAKEAPVVGVPFIFDIRDEPPYAY